MTACSECGVEKKTLTVHGTCWKCHVNGIQSASKCKNCRSTQSIIDEHRTSQNVTTSVKVVEKP